MGVAGEGDADRCRGAGRGCGFECANGRRGIAGDEAIEVLGGGEEAGKFGFEGEVVIGGGVGGVGEDGFEGRVVG